VSDETVVATIPCDIEGCLHQAESRQRLGLHKYQVHGIRSPRPPREPKSEKKGKAKVGGPLDTDSLMMIVLEQVCPNGIPPAKLLSVIRWREATEKFMQEMR
jgi:hypothetical protein